MTFKHTHCKFLSKFPKMKDKANGSDRHWNCKTFTMDKEITGNSSLFFQDILQRFAAQLDDTVGSDQILMKKIHEVNNLSCSSQTLSLLAVFYSG